jgi:hypothetical protein
VQATTAGPVLLDTGPGSTLDTLRGGRAGLGIGVVRSVDMGNSALVGSKRRQVSP